MGFWEVIAAFLLGMMLEGVINRARRVKPPYNKSVYERLKEIEDESGTNKSN